MRYLTQDIAGTGGVIKLRPEDFLVEEQPLYEPTGEGEHLMVLIEKRGLTTAEATTQMAKAMGIRRRLIGVAGLKDKQAITRQIVTIHLPGGKPDEDYAMLQKVAEHTDVQIHWAQRHINKLRRGHLKGNRFVVYVRQTDPLAVLRAKRVMDTLEQQGVPNGFGPQRFGWRGVNHRIGAALLKGDAKLFMAILLGQPHDNESDKIRESRQAYEAGDIEQALTLWPRPLQPERFVLESLYHGQSPEEVLPKIQRHHVEFWLNALQSGVFNAVLASRMNEGTFAQLLPGDLAWKHDNGAVFAVDEETAAKENAPDGRVASQDVSPSGPMWGPRMSRAAGDVAAIEAAALADIGLTPESFDNAPPMLAGVRRPMRVPITDIDVSGGMDELGGYVRLSFSLPKGAFATAVLAEVMKPDDGIVPQGEGSDE